MDDKQMQAMREQLDDMRASVEEFRSVSLDVRDSLLELRQALQSKLVNDLEAKHSPAKKRQCVSGVSVPVPDVAPSGRLVFRVDDQSHIYVHSLLSELHRSGLSLAVDFDVIIAECASTKAAMHNTEEGSRLRMCDRLPYNLFYVNMKGHKSAKHELVLLLKIASGKLQSWKIEQGRKMHLRDACHFLFGPNSRVPLTINSSRNAPASWFAIPTSAEPARHLDVSVMFKSNVRLTTTYAFCPLNGPFYVDKFCRVLKQLTSYEQASHAVGEGCQWWAHVGDVKLAYPSGLSDLTNLDILWFNDSSQTHSYMAASDGPLLE